MGIRATMAFSNGGDLSNQVSVVKSASPRHPVNLRITRFYSCFGGPYGKEKYRTLPLMEVVPAASIYENSDPFDLLVFSGRFHRESGAESWATSAILYWEHAVLSQRSRPTYPLFGRWPRWHSALGFQ